MASLRNTSYCDFGKVLQIIAHNVEGTKTVYDNIMDMDVQEEKGTVLALVDGGMMGQWYAVIDVEYDGGAKLRKLFDTLGEAEAAGY